MRPSVSTAGMLVGLAMVALGLASACGGSSGSATGSGGAGGGLGSGGAGSGGTGGSGGAGGPGSGGAGGAADASPDVAMSDATADGGTDTADGTDTSPGGAAADAADDLLSPSEITKVAPTLGCGKAPGPVGAATILTMGTKLPGCADSRCAPWMYPREYFVYLPQPYDNTRAYPLVFQGPGCGGTATNVYPLNNNVDNTVIRVGLRPPPDIIGHSTNPNQGCFDDREGDDSVDWVFYETLYDKLASELCFDKNRVFVSGNSSGAWFANELGCKYAGDATRPIRGVLTNGGSLPSQPQYAPTCTDKPLAGMWIADVSDNTDSFFNYKLAINRAMKVNGCTVGTSVDTTEFDDFPIGGGNPDPTCRRIRGCPELSPLTLCQIRGSAISSHDTVANPGFSTFIKLFSKPPFLTP